MEGVHPFQGVWSGTGEPPSIEEHIHRGEWPYVSSNYFKPGRFALPLSILPPPVQELMKDCFITGFPYPDKRPSAEEWRQALQSTLHTVTTCAANPQHRYSNHLDQCPWCERVDGKLPDSFPALVQRASSTSVIQDIHADERSAEPAARHARILAVQGTRRTGATTTAVNLAACLADAGYKTLLVDMSPDADATNHLGVDSHTVGISVYDVLFSENVKVAGAILRDSRPNLSLLPAKTALYTTEYATEIELAYLDSREKPRSELLKR